jgi:hypothetical protein
MYVYPQLTEEYCNEARCPGATSVAYDILSSTGMYYDDEFTFVFLIHYSDVRDVVSFRFVQPRTPC